MTPSSFAQAAAPGENALFPKGSTADATAQAPAEAPTLRGLAAALAQQNRDVAVRMSWQFLAAMARSREQGVSPSEYLAAGYRGEKLNAAESAAVQNCLLGAWRTAGGLALFTPENIALMERGESPRGVRGADRGKVISFNDANPPAIVVGSGPAAGSSATSAPAQGEEPKSGRTPLPYVVKSFEVKIRDIMPLDAYGLTNMDLRVDSVAPDQSVTFLLEDRTADRYGALYVDEGTVKRGKERANGSAHVVGFRPEPIPGTKTRGIKLATCNLATIYLDENLGAQIYYRILIYEPGEMLILNQLSPEERKKYEYRPASMR